MKRAQMFKLVSLILVVLGGVVLLAQTKLFAGLFQEENAVQLCRTSFVTSSIANLPIAGKQADFECPREEVNIKKHEVSDRSGNVKTDLILEMIGEQLVRCNFKTAEGTADPYEQDLLTSSAACLVCAEISFGDRLQETGIHDLDLVSFLDRDVPDKEYSYREYLEKNRGDVDYESGEGQIMHPVSVDREYYVMHLLTHAGDLPSFLVDAQSAIIFVRKDQYRDAGCSFLAN